MCDKVFLIGKFKLSLKFSPVFEVIYIIKAVVLPHVCTLGAHS